MIQIFFVLTATVLLYSTIQGFRGRITLTPTKKLTGASAVVAGVVLMILFLAVSAFAVFPVQALSWLGF